MNNFYNIQDTVFFSPTKYISAWQKQIGLSFLDDGNLDKKKVQSLASHAKNLWTAFNENRVDLKKDYMSAFQEMQSYLSAFLLSNVERVYGILSSPDARHHLQDLLKQHQDAEEFVVADFGAGPLSASVGFLCALECLLSRNKMLACPKKIKIYAIDRSERMVSVGTELLKNALGDKCTVEIHFLTSAVKMEQNAHVILCANIFNEIPEKHRFKTAQALAERLCDLGLFLIVEPAQSVHSKSLGTLRDELLSGKEKLTVLAPCAHQKPCPLSSTANRSDWCWFRHYWTPPKAQIQIDKLIGIDHFILNYSYVLFRKNYSLQKQDLFQARVVSNPFALQADHHLQKILLCDDSGQIKDLVYDPNEMDLAYQRGDRLQ